MINAAFAVPMISIPQAEQLRFITRLSRESKNAFSLGGYECAVYIS